MRIALLCLRVCPNLKVGHCQCVGKCCNPPDFRISIRCLVNLTIQSYLIINHQASLKILPFNRLGELC
jgi:hypothetical protein